MRLRIGLILCLAAGVAAAMPVIGIYTDETAQTCQMDIQVGDTKELYLIAQVDAFDFPGGVRGAEFRIDNLPSTSGYTLGVIATHWTATITLGDLDTDMSLAWGVSQYGDYVVLGRLVFQVFSGGWIDDQHLMTVEEGDLCQCIVLLDHNLQQIEAMGGRFTFNCDYDCGCGGFQSQESDWGEVKQLYSR